MKKPKLPEVEKLVQDQKLEEACAILDKTIGSTKHDDELLAYALLRRAELRIALGGYETAVRELKAATWPTSTVPAIVVELYYAKALTTYVQSYGWEIGQREKIDGKSKPGGKTIDLKSLTRDQIVAEATAAYASVWAHRKDVDTWPVGLLAPYLELNTYPDNIRGTLRDAISYLVVAHLADSSLWRADQSNELFRVDFDALLHGGGPPVPLDGDAHPIVKLGSVLDDLEAFHQQGGRAEAALEARLERLRRLHAAYSDKAERTKLVKALEDRLSKERQRPWWAMGQALLADWARDDGRLVRAHTLAKDGQAAYPKSMGGAICAEIAASIEAPDYQLSAMSTDGLGKPSVTISAHNLPRIYFRAYRTDPRARLERSKDYNLWLDGDELRRIVASSKPAAVWDTTLPPTPDFRAHRSHVTPPLKAKGHYVIVASARADFAEGHNRLVAAQLTISDLVLSTRTDRGRSLDVTVFDGPSGHLVEGANIEAWALDWQHGHHKIAEARSGRDGVAHLSPPSSGRSLVVLAQKGEDLAFDPNAQYLNGRADEPKRTGALVYTDRSVYRPGQKVLWKVVVYSGRAKDGRFAVVPGLPFTVELRDANYQVVSKLDVKSNSYGSASGEFSIPAQGRLLGGWSVVASVNGSQAIRVEEYKRPTFEVTLKEPPAPLRLNQPARVVGEARYYFGLPVTSGTARYTVVREPVYPYWWWWYGYRADRNEKQTIARGSAPLGADGGFEVKFLPEAKADLDPHISYRYAISVDVTDEGGETRSAQRSYRLGRTSIEAVVSSGAGFYDPSRAVELSLRRSDLDGNPRAGKGTWKLVSLEAPSKTLLPAELPPSEAKAGEGETSKVVTAGDRVRPRYETQYDPVQVLASWKDGAVGKQGDVAASDKGDATIKLGTLSPGAYRLRYETADDRGMKADAFCDFIVSGRTLPLPALLRAEQTLVRVGDKVRLLVSSGLADQTLLLDTYRSGELVERRILDGKAGVVEIVMKEADRGGLAFQLIGIRDHQPLALSQTVQVPWDNQALKVSFSTFRDKVRPGAKETFRVTVEGEGKQHGRLAAGAAELLAYMYDRSLDLFAPHNPPSPLSLFPGRAYASPGRINLGQAHTSWLAADTLRDIPSAPRPEPDRYSEEDGYGIGGPGMRFGSGRGYGRGAPMKKSLAMAAPPAAAPAPARMRREALDVNGEMADEKVAAQPVADRSDEGGEKKPAAEALRSNFAETAFFQPHLLTDGKGETSFEFTVPDSVTSWNVWVHAITKDLRSGSAMKETRSVKDLLVRPYLPRFFREGDEAELKVVVNNAGDAKLDGELRFDIVDPETRQSKASLFSMKPETRAFSVEPGKSASLAFPVKAPRTIGTFAIIAQATARSGKESYSDGEIRPVPVLPSRLHLTQSRFVTLRDKDSRTMRFDDLAKQDDPSRTNEQMVVTLDAQLFYTVLRALPYLIEYPYECTEQTLNRFVSTGIVTSLFGQYPQVAKMADQMSKRTTQLQAWDAGDANRKMGLEEAPFLFEAKGGAKQGEDASLINVLNRNVALAHRDAALDKLRKSQTSLGAFPWFAGGPPSPYMTLYILYGFAKAAEFKVEVPKDMVQRGWHYLAEHYRSEYAHRMMKADCCWEFLSLLNYVASSYPDASWTGDALTMDERRKILDFTFAHWKSHSPYVKGLLALTLKRMGRAADAKKVWDSVMDSAKTAPDQGTFWAPEDRSWLWYNDTIESHAFALRVLTELDPQNQKKDGLVLWLLLNKKLNQWKSTRATAEVIYSLARYMQADHSLGVREAATVHVGSRQQTYTFESDRYVGKVQMIVPGPEVTAQSATVKVEKESKGVMFASATWSFATDKLPSESRGDFFTVSRRYFLRENNGKEFVLRPLADGQTLKPGDEVEVELAISSKHAAEYVHLRDPRGAGFEPTSLRSQWKWDLGLVYYEEIRDSGENFFFEQLPAGQYTFRYRLRATTSGAFRVGPATLQSMYAPEFSAYSAGHVLKIGH